MELKDIFLTPIYVTLIILLAKAIKPLVTSSFTQKYYYPALIVKILGAILLGVIYQFYYKGGDTFNYFTYGKILNRLISQDFDLFLKLLFTNYITDPNIINRASTILWIDSPSEFAVLKISGYLGFISFNTYTVNAIFFAYFAFTGVWALYNTILKIFPSFYGSLAWAVFFIPSLFFWGSGLLKDTLCVGALGWLFYSFYNLLISKKRLIVNALIFILSMLLLLTIKKYILLAFMPAMAFWLFIEYNRRIKNKFIQLIAKPIFLLFGILSAYYIGINITKGDRNYDIEQLAIRTKINADYLYSVSQQQQGSGYKLGELDGTFQGMIRLIPEAINVSLFRPYIWEVKNPFMLLSALENVVFLLLVFWIVVRLGPIKVVSTINKHPLLLFSLIFTLIFAFAVGISSNNFGTLVRYKIPLLPFFSILVLYLFSLTKKKKYKRILESSI